MEVELTPLATAPTEIAVELVFEAEARTPNAIALVPEALAK